MFPDRGRIHGFRERKIATEHLMLVVEEKTVPRTVRVVTPIALWAMALLAIPYDIDTLTVWTMNLYIDHSILLYGQGQKAMLSVCQRI